MTEWKSTQGGGLFARHTNSSIAISELFFSSLVTKLQTLLLWISLVDGLLD